MAAVDHDSSSSSDDEVCVTPRLNLSVARTAPSYDEESGAVHHTIKCHFHIAGLSDPWVQDLSDGNTVFNLQKNIYEHVKASTPDATLGDMSKIDIKHGEKSWLNSLPLSLNDLLGSGVSEVTLYVDVPRQ